MLRNVAILFMDSKGVYSTLPDLDCWDEKRDARKYNGVSPVVAHPPCQLWGRFAHVNYARWGGEHNRPGNDGGCFASALASALASVRRCGGVLEHPAFTDAWITHGLYRPDGGCWTACLDGWVAEVWQSAYGHRANKHTWLYYVGDTPPAPMKWERPKGSHQIGGYNKRVPRDRCKPTISGKAASATPPSFAEALITLARNSR